MTVYPQAIDDDRSIIRIDDLISELGTVVINQLRSSVFAIEKELGITPSGSTSSLDSRISISLNKDGTLRTEAIEAAGFVALPIVDKYIANNAGIKEYKLDLDVSTLDLQAQINAIDIVANNTASLAAETNTDLLNHIAGVALLADGITRARHYDNQIDLSFTLYDKDGNALTAIQLAQALYQINQLLINHQNTIYDAHPATAITVFAQDWNELPTDAENLQEVLDFLDNQETLSTGVDRATLNSNGIPRNARVQRIDLDGYNYEIVPETKCRAYLAELNQTGPRDSITNGDDVISFVPEDDSDFSFDAKFTQVQVGDILRINYGNGISSEFRVSSFRLTPGVEWVVRVDGWNLVNRDGTSDGYAYARIDRRRHDINTKGVLAVAGAHADTVPDGACSTALDSIIVASPRGAMAIGIGFDPGALNEKHYNLWFRLYPTGKPDIHIDLYPIDVTGNEGTTPGAYSLETIVEATNLAFRASGNNYRFIAFQHEGEFGIMLADSWRNSAFTIIAGQTASTIIEEGIYNHNVIGDATDGYDALGFGAGKAVVASPVTSGYTTALEAVNMPTIIHSPVKDRNYLANGSRRDFLRTKSYTDGDGYWQATIISNFSDIPNNTITTTYRINKALFAEKLAPGKTIVVQPTSESDTSIVGYGRFIIGDILYNEVADTTDVLVVNSVHAGGSAMGAVLPENQNVIIYLTEDSVGFNAHHLVEQGTFHRYHEIFVEQYGKTQAIERARMEKQSADTAKINTDRANWQIRNVSPKLRGYRLDDDLRFWVRFVITNYDNTTGEYTGYIGSPPDIGVGWDTTPGISRNGPLTTGFKNVPVRFYDETYINFIDIEFREIGTIPGTIISTNTPQYIDIEIFPTLAEDNEVMRIAGVSHNEIVVGSITDLREFGTTSEENFTDSAIRFIESGERYLHANGVVRGFEYIGTGVNDAVLQFSGGFGLINGSFVAISAMDVVIPEMIGSSGTYNVFVCATKNGTLRTIPENTGAQFFQSITGEFVESYSFQDIIDSHKELLLLYVVNVTIYPGTELEPEIGNLTLNSVSDARKYILNETANITLSISDKPETSNFTNFDQIITWAKKTTAKTLYIKVKGDVEINSTIDLTGITSKLVFEDDGGVIKVNTPTGFLVKDGVEFRGLNIVYNSVLTSYDSSNLCHLSSTQSCIRFVAGASNCRIQRCDFSQTTGERYPYIALYSTINPASGIIENIYIEENIFHDATLSSYNCAIGFYQSGISASNHIVTTLRNIKVNNNIIDGYQSILITGQDQTFKTENVEICGNNSSGYVNSDIRSSGFLIGVSARRTDVTIGSLSKEEHDKSIRICNNNCSAIYPAGANGKYLETLVSNASFIISGNECYSINVYTSVYGGIPYIQDNVVNYPELISAILTNIGLNTSTTIKILGSGTFQINRNQVYVASNGTGIKISAGYGHVCNNRLYKVTTSSITAFIDTEGSDVYANIYDNFLSSYRSSPFVGGTSYVLKHSDNCTVDRNTNDLITMPLDGCSGIIGSSQTSASSFGIGQGDYAAYGLLYLVAEYNQILVNIGPNASSIIFAWKVPLVSVIPYGARILSFNYNAYWWSSAGTMSGVITQAWIVRGNTSLQTSGTISMLTESTDYAVSMDFNSGIGFKVEDAFLYVRMHTGGTNDTGQLKIKNPTISWCW
jgi:hypothetical protein